MNSAMLCDLAADVARSFVASGRELEPTVDVPRLGLASTRAVFAIATRGSFGFRDACVTDAGEFFRWPTQREWWELLAFVRALYPPLDYWRIAKENVEAERYRAHIAFGFRIRHAVHSKSPLAVLRRACASKTDASTISTNRCIAFDLDIPKPYAGLLLGT